MKYTILLFSLLFVCSLSAQEYKTYKKVNDSTYLETRSFEEEDAVQLSEDAVLSAFFREMDRWARIENRHFNNLLAAQRVFGALNRDQRALIPDTTYVEYNAFRDTIYSYPELKRDESNQIVYDSEIMIGDTTYSAQLFRNAGGAQVLRIESPAGSYAARFVEADKTIRVGANTPLPQLNDFIDLRWIRENDRFVLFFGMADGNKIVRLKIRKR
jgi:hypothetical protein